MLQRLKRQSVKASSIIADHPPMSSISLASMASELGPHRPSSLHHTQSQRPPQHSHYHHQRSRSVVVPPVLLEYETSPGHGSTDDVLMRDAQGDTVARAVATGQELRPALPYLRITTAEGPLRWQRILAVVALAEVAAVAARIPASPVSTWNWISKSSSTAASACCTRATLATTK